VHLQVFATHGLKKGNGTVNFLAKRRVRKDKKEGRKMAAEKCPILICLPPSFCLFSSRAASRARQYFSALREKVLADMRDSDGGQCLEHKK
jgi:hypothetical protein